MSLPILSSFLILWQAKRNVRESCEISIVILICVIYKLYIFFKRFTSVSYLIISDANEKAKEDQGNENGNYQRNCRR